jgi:predicted phosphohydrolase
VRVFAIADPHLSSRDPKPMDVFGASWQRHPEAFFEGWRRVVGEDDLVLVPGDISWAMRLDDALPDLEAIAELPGRSVLLRGNHDYWWPSLRRLRATLPAGMQAIQHDAVRVGDVIVAGTRGWVVPGAPGTDADDERIYRRELHRLRLSLDAAAALGPGSLVVMLHFPPTNPRGDASEMLDTIVAAAPRALVFGHVHGDAPVHVPTLPGTAVRFVAADALRFEPALILP